MPDNRDKIIDDLSRVRPKGPKGVKLTYDINEHYDYDVSRYRKEYIPSVPNYGYTDDQLFSLGFKSHQDVVSYLRERDFDGCSNWNLGGRKATLTRRSNKVWEKISDAVSRVKTEGRPGIYRVSHPYASTRDLGHLYAESTKEAQQNADLFYGYLLGQNHTKCRVKFVKMGGVEDLRGMNEKTQEALEDAIKTAHKRIQSYQQELEDLNSRLSTMRIVEQQQIAVEMKDAIEEAADQREVAEKK